MTAALNGAGVPLRTIVVAGLAFAIAGALSMFFSNYLSTRAEIDSLKIDVERERMEIETEPEEEREELEQLLRKEGYDAREIGVIMERLEKDKEMWLREQLRHELHLHIEDISTDPVGKAGAAGLAFLLLALISLSPYLFGLAHVPALVLSAVLSVTALFVLGSKAFTLRNFSLMAGLESAGIGALAAGILYALGLLIANI
jgi:VIT1/CCC1 family predicted Fe2+/Mn2+ transporter